MYESIVQLKMPSADGKLYATDAINPETVLRVILPLSVTGSPASGSLASVHVAAPQASIARDHLSAAASRALLAASSSRMVRTTASQAL